MLDKGCLFNEQALMGYRRNAPIDLKAGKKQDTINFQSIDSEQLSEDEKLEN